MSQTGDVLLVTSQPASQPVNPSLQPGRFTGWPRPDTRPVMKSQISVLSQHNTEQSQSDFGGYQIFFINFIELKLIEQYDALYFFMRNKVSQ